MLCEFSVRGWTEWFLGLSHLSLPLVILLTPRDIEGLLIPCSVSPLMERGWVQTQRGQEEELVSSVFSNPLSLSISFPLFSWGPASPLS